MKKGDQTLFSGTQAQGSGGVIPALARAPAWGRRRASGGFVDEDAVTLRLRPVPTRRRFFADLPIDLPTLLATVVVGAGVWLVSTQPLPETTIARSPITQPVAQPPGPAFEPEPVLASGLSVPAQTLSDQFDEDEIIIFVEDVDDDEVVIFDDAVDDDEILVFDDTEPPFRTKRADRRARRIARRRTKQGQRARSRGDTLAAERHFRAALKAWPSHAPATAALAELYLTDRRFGRL